MKKEFIENYEIHKLRPYENNPRENEGAIEKVMASITDFGFLSPIVADEKGEILAGHTRYLAARKMHLATVPALIVSGLTENQKKAFRIADNKAGEFSEWDNEKLFEEVQAIDWNELSPKDWGLDLDAIEQALDDAEKWESLLSVADENISDQAMDKTDPSQYVLRLQGPPALFDDELLSITEKFKANGGTVGGNFRA